MSAVADKQLSEQPITNNDGRVLYLRGDETALMPNGKLESVLPFLNVTSRDKDSLRRAMLIFTPEEISDPHLLQQRLRAVTPDQRQDIDWRIRAESKRVARHLKHAVSQIALTGGETKLPRDIPSYLAQNKREAQDLASKVERNLRGAAAMVSKPGPLEILGSDAWSRAITGETLGEVLTPVEMQEAIKTIEGEERIFTPMMRRYMGQVGMPIAIRKHATLLQNNGFGIDPSSVLLINHEIIEMLRSNNPRDWREGQRILARGLINAIMLDYMPTLDELGLKNPEEWKAISAEINGPGKQFMEADVVANDSSIDTDYFPVDVLSFMHFWLNAGEFDEQRIREQMPNCCKFYDRYMSFVMERVTELERQHLGKKSRDQDTEQRGGFKPKPMTSDPLEAQMLDSARRFVDNSLLAKPPFNLCSCDLILNDRVRGGYPVKIVLRNNLREERVWTVNTGTHNLEQAVILKRALHSQLLSHPGISPLWATRRRDGDGSSALVPTDILPQNPPRGVTLVEHKGFYYAELTFAEKDEQGATLVARLALGLESGKGEDVQSEAQHRLQFVTRRLESIRGDKQWETIGALQDSLRQHVRENDRPFKWRTNQVIDLPDFAGAALAFPAEQAQAAYPQTTTIRRAYLRFENDEAKYPNPTWRLMIDLDVKGLGDGTQTTHLCPTINLHTANETAAFARGKESVESLIANAQELATKYPAMRWERSGPEDLLIRDAQGGLPQNPDPQNLAHLHEDMAHFKSSYAVEEVAARETHDGRITVTLGVLRGTKAEQDIVPMNAAVKRPIRCSFSVAAADAAHIPEITDAVDTLFSTVIRDAYGNRTFSNEGAIIRKERKGFSPRTIENALSESFENTMRYGNFESLRMEKEGFAARVGSKDISPDGDHIETRDGMTPGKKT